MGLYTDLPIYHQTYQLLQLVVNRIREFPRDLKFSLGDRIRNETVDLVVFIYKANSNTNKVPFLSEMLERLQVVQLLLRLAKDMKCLSIKQFSEISIVVQGLSKQTRGWLASQPLEKKSKREQNVVG
jgi:hypothetical protein